MIQKLSPNFKAGRSGYKPEIIVLHISTGSLASLDNWFSRPESQVSAHYGIGFNGEVHQYVDELNTAWANGRVDKPTAKIVKSREGVNPNLYTLSIENEGQDLSIVHEAQINAVVELIRTLGAKYNIPISRDTVIGHYEIYSLKPNCPATNKEIINRIVLQAQGNSKPTQEELLQKVAELTALIKKL